MFTYTKEGVFADGDIIKIQCGDGVKAVSEHIHEFLEFIYISEGSGVHFIDGIKYSVSKGNLLFVNYGQTHAIGCSPEMKFVNILLEPSFMSNELIDSENIAELFQSSLFEEFFGESCDYSHQCISFGGEGSEAEDMARLVDMMVEEYAEKRTGYRSVLHGCVRILFTRLLRKLSAYSGYDSAEFIENLDVMKSMIEYIDENCVDKITLEKLAAKSFYNPSYFGRLLKRYCGKSFTQYLKEKRISLSASLLDNSSETVEKIMNSVGYRDKKLFYRHFREIYGKTPSEYRASKTDNKHE